MAILCFKIPCLYLIVSFLQGFLCNEDLNVCSQSIKIYKDFECIHRFEEIQSQVRVYCNVAFIHDLYKNISNYHSRHMGMHPRITPVNLLAYPVLFSGSTRYRAHFCIEMSYEDLADVDSILLVFSTLEGNGVIPNSAVVHHGMKHNGKRNAKYGRIGCYWHYTLLLATSEITVHLDITFLRGNRSAGCGKYYFRIPFWERFNNEKDVDPCSFAPFAYVEESENLETETVHVGSVNCSRLAFIEIEQRKESSGELLKKEIIPINSWGRGSTRVEFLKTLHYYEAFFREKALEEIKEDPKDESHPTNIIILLIIIFVAFFVVLLFCNPKDHRFVSRNSSTLREKPRVKFIYCIDSKRQVYRKMAETLILFMEKYCDIIVSDHPIDVKETSKTRLLSEKFDVIVLIPYPSIGENNSNDTCIFRSIKHWERTKKDCIIVELPFWSKNNAELAALCEPFAKWKRFTLMDEFLSMVIYIQRYRLCFQRRLLCPISFAEIHRKLEENNLTNEEFLFCLKEAFGNASNETFERSFTLPPEGFPNLQEMEI